jgi:hypothetical protein
MALNLNVKRELFADHENLRDIIYECIFSHDERMLQKIGSESYDIPNLMFSIFN